MDPAGRRTVRRNRQTSLDHERTFSDPVRVFQLTARQREILDFLQRHQSEQGYWPSIREIQSRFRFKSTNAVFGHLKALEGKGARAGR